MFSLPRDIGLWVVVRLQALAAQERAQTLGEYALVVSLVGVGVVVTGLILFRATLIGGYEAMMNCLNGSCPGG